MDSGDLVPDELTINMLKEEVESTWIKRIFYGFQELESAKL